MQNFHLCSFESRRAQEIRSLIERQGAIATVAPSMRELPLLENAEAFHFAEELLQGRVDLVVFMTGVGAETLLATLELKHERAEILSALDQCQILVRGPKPTAVLKKWGTHIDHRAPEPNTWREILQTLEEAEFDFENRTIAVQEYGQPNEEFYAVLTERNAEVLPVSIYRWGLPADTAPLLDALLKTIEGTFDALLFTSAQQVRHVLQVAGEHDREQEFLTAASRSVIASIGPTCSEALLELGLPIGVEASPPKMGQLVKVTIEHLQKLHS